MGPTSAASLRGSALPLLPPPTAGPLPYRRRRWSPPRMLSSEGPPRAPPRVPLLPWLGSGVGRGPGPGAPASTSPCRPAKDVAPSGGPAASPACAVRCSATAHAASWRLQVAAGHGEHAAGPGERLESGCVGLPVGRRRARARSWTRRSQTRRTASARRARPCAPRPRWRSARGPGSWPARRRAAPVRERRSATPAV